ncbi:type II toxin-antitoxin system PemK/MazF family toxin [Streptomyces sp. NPDC057927]
MKRIENALDYVKSIFLDRFSNSTSIDQTESVLKDSRWIKRKVVLNNQINSPKGNSKGDLVNRKRARVYWAELGTNVGSEFNDPHYCVVWKPYGTHSVIIPLTSVKTEKSQPYKSKENGYIFIGEIEGLNGSTKESYAILSQIRTLSNKRLTGIFDKGEKKFVNIKLSNQQMDDIEAEMVNHFLGKSRKEVYNLI